MKNCCHILMPAFKYQLFLSKPASTEVNTRLDIVYVTSLLYSAALYLLDVWSQVRLQDLHLLPLFAPVLKSMFADDYMEMEQKTEKKKRQKDRKQNEGKIHILQIFLNHNLLKILLAGICSIFQNNFGRFVKFEIFLFKQVFSYVSMCSKFVMHVNHTVLNVNAGCGYSVARWRATACRYPLRNIEFRLFLNEVKDILTLLFNLKPVISPSQKTSLNIAVSLLVHQQKYWC